jgi:hypothetical protein
VYASTNPNPNPNPEKYVRRRQIHKYLFSDSIGKLFFSLNIQNGMFSWKKIFKLFIGPTLVHLCKQNIAKHLQMHLCKQNNAKHEKNKLTFCKQARKEQVSFLETGKRKKAIHTCYFLNAKSTFNKKSKFLTISAWNTYCFTNRGLSPFLVPSTCFPDPAWDSRVSTVTSYVQPNISCTRINFDTPAHSFIVHPPFPPTLLIPCNGRPHIVIIVL